MTKTEFIKMLKDEAGFEKLTQAEIAYEKVFAMIANSLEKGETVSISGFGSFKPVKRAARKGRNPQTGKEIQIAESTSVKFTPSKTLKERL